MAASVAAVIAVPLRIGSNRMVRARKGWGRETGKLAAQELCSELVVAGEEERAGIYRGRKERGMRRWEFGRKERTSRRKHLGVGAWRSRSSSSWSP
jgi:hypothetical protein